MKLVTAGKIVVLSKERNVSESTGKESFKLAILQGAEAGSITCTKEVFEKINGLTEYVMAVTYDDKYNYCKVTGVDEKTAKPFGR